MLTRALVTRLLLDGKRTIGVEIARDGVIHRIEADGEVILSLGAIHTPKVLMQSGIGDATELRRLGISPVEHLPGVGQNFQDHVAVAGCVWEYRQPLAPRNNAAEVTFFWKSDLRLSTPDLQPFQIEVPFVSPELAAKFDVPAHAWSMFPGVVRPKSRGWLRLTGPNPQDPVEIHANTLEHPDDFKALVRGVELCREIGNSAALRPFVKREVLPNGLKRVELENFVRDGAVTYWHQTCTAKMGRDAMSVVDGGLRVYGIDNLRVADGSVLPHVTTGNTMAPCVVVGEHAAAFVKATHSLESDL